MDTEHYIFNVLHCEYTKTSKEYLDTLNDFYNSKIEWYKRYFKEMSKDTPEWIAKTNLDKRNILTLRTRDENVFSIISEISKDINDLKEKIRTLKLDYFDMDRKFDP